MALVDYLGRPIQLKSLTKELASPSMVNIRNPWFDSVATGLTPERLGQILLQVDQNDIEDYLTLAEEMEERDLHYHSVLSTRKLAVTGLSVTIESPTDAAEDVKLADYVSEVFNSEEVQQLIADQMDALGKGYSVSEIMWDKSMSQWEPRCYEHRDPRHFQFDRETGKELRLKDSANLMDGVELAPYKFVQHRPRIKTGLPIRGGLARLAAVAFMCKGYSMKDWLAFMEVFGMPLRIGKYGNGATPEQKAELLRAVSSIGSDAACIIPEGMLIDLVAASSTSGGDKLFMGFADWIDGQVSKGVIGQTMTSDDGSSLAQAKVHDEVRSDIKLNDAVQMAITLRRDLVRPLIDLNFGPKKKNQYPKVRLTVEQAEDLESLSRSLPPFIKLGLRVEESVIRDKFSLPEPDEGALLLGAAAPEPKEVGGKADVDTKDKPESPEEAAQARATAVSELTKKMLAGRTLTSDQRVFLAAATVQQPTELDKLADKAPPWQAVMDPLLEPISDLANESESYEEFIAGLEELQLDARDFMRALSTLTFQARGIGDATDKV
jgi:phage gp29-like protein